MYAVIDIGSKQARVEVGSRLSVERLSASEGDEVRFSPLLVVDEETVHATAPALAQASVVARVVGATKGPKITGFTYKAKARGRRRWGHRQGYTEIEVTEIATGDAARPRKARA